MTTARHRFVDPEEPGFYHCISRCMRRAQLCGFDAPNGRYFEHRRNWVMAHPEAVLYQADDAGLLHVDYEGTEHFSVSWVFLANQEKFLSQLLA